MLRRARMALLAAVLVASAAPSHADDLMVDDIWFVQRDAGYSIYADLRLDNTQPIENLVQGGYAASFLFEVQFIQKRWYWDRIIGDITWTGSLTYDSLLDRYIVQEDQTQNQTQKQFANLDDALSEILQIRSKPSRDPAFERLFDSDNIYLQARFLLLLDGLPQPVQIALLLSNEFDSVGSWTAFELTIKE